MSRLSVSLWRLLITGIAALTVSSLMELAGRTAEMSGQPLSGHPTRLADSSLPNSLWMDMAHAPRSPHCALAGMVDRKK